MPQSLLLVLASDEVSRYVFWPLSIGHSTDQLEWLHIKSKHPHQKDGVR